MCGWRKNKRGKRLKENKDREEKSGNVCGGEKPRGKKGKKKVFWIGLNSFQNTKILINFKTKIDR